MFLNNSQNSQENTCIGVFLIKLQTLKTATFLERDSSETWEIFKNSLFYWKYPVAASDSFRFPALKAVTQTYSVKKLCQRLWHRCFPVSFEKFLRTPFLTDYLRWLLLQPATLLKKRFPQKCFSVNLAKFLRTSFDRALPDDCFLSLSANFEKFFRTPLI